MYAVSELKNGHLKSIKTSFSMIDVYTRLWYLALVKNRHSNGVALISKHRYNPLDLSKKFNPTMRPQKKKDYIV